MHYFQAPNNLAADVFRNVEEATSRIYLTSPGATHEEADPRVLLHCNMDMFSTIGITY